MYSEGDGYGVIKGLLSHEQIVKLLSEITNISNASSTSGPGLRNLLNHPPLNHLAKDPSLLRICTDILGPGVRPVKITLFEKTEKANWKVPPHQDVTIAVREKVDTPGFKAWTEKGGIPHVQPPSYILESMIAVRLHLDDADENNGALKVWPGSHIHGRLLDHGIQSWIDANKASTCAANAGDAMIMRPLLIPASSPAKTPTHRRVIHIEYAGINLPNGMEWM